MKNLFLSAATAAALLTTAAKAETVNCTEITSVPFVITVQGVYCLKSDLSSSLINGDMIDIQTNNVIVDLNGFKLGGLGAGVGTNAVGISAINRKNITFRNGSVRGFLVGVALAGASASGHVVENLLLDRKRNTGIQVGGSNHVVRNNRVVNTGGGSHTISAVGILASGARNMVIADNIVSGTSETGTAVGILVSATILVEVRNNTILDTKDATNKIGISIGGGTDITVIGNRILNAAGSGSGGVTASSSTGVNCIGNTVAGFAAALPGCTFTSADNITPP